MSRKQYAQQGYKKENEHQGCYQNQKKRRTIAERGVTKTFKSKKNCDEKKKVVANPLVPVQTLKISTQPDLSIRTNPSFPILDIVMRDAA